MKLIYIIKSFAATAGVERVMSDKMNWLAEKSYSITLVTYEQGNHQLVYQLNQSIRHFDLNTRFFEIGKYSYYKRPFCFLKLRHKFKNRLQDLLINNKPDVIITTTYSMPLLDIIVKVNPKAKLILESHIACYKVRKSNEFSHKSLLYLFASIYDKITLRYVKDFDKLITLTEGDANDWRATTSKIHIIPNPITLFPDTVAQIGKTKRIICVGRLHEQKGFDMLIDAFSLISSKCPDWNIDIFGSGDEEKMLKDRISANHLEKRITINPPTHEIFTEYQKSDFFVLSSRYEGYALVLIEAMACGLPCVSFRCKYGPEEAIKDGENGILVNNGDIMQLSEKILWMIQHPDARVRMGKAARESVRRYKKDMIMQQWTKLFESLEK